MRIFLLGVCMFLLGISMSSCDTTDVSEENGDSGNQDTGVTTLPDDATTWAAQYVGGLAEEMEDVIVTSAGGYLVTGTMEDYDTDEVHVWLAKYSDDGEIDWQKAYGGDGIDTGYKARETSDGGFIVAGATESFSNGSSDIWVFKIDSAGGIEWQKSYGGSGVEQAWSIDITTDGGYIVAGGTSSFGAGGADCLVLKLDANGNIVWQKAFGGSADEAGGGEFEEYVARVFEDGDGNYLVSCITFSFGSGDSDIWVFKLDADGSILWENAYGDEDEDGMWMIREKSDGGYLVPGYFTPTSDYDTDLWAMHLNKDGTIAWQNTYGVSGVWDEALTLGATSDGGALLGGFYEEDNDSDWSLTLVRVDTDGNLQWSSKYERGFDWANAVAEFPGGGFAVAGATMNSLSDQVDFLMLNMSAEGTIGSSCNLLKNLEVSKKSTSVTPVATQATVTDTNITPQNTSATVKNTENTAKYACSG